MFQLQQASGAAGGGGGGVLGGVKRLGQDRQQGLPLRGQGGVTVIAQGEVDQLGEPCAQGGAEAVHLAARQAFGGGDGVFQVFDDLGEGAQAGAFLTAGAGVQDLGGIV